jgi:hypothetical protein
MLREEVLYILFLLITAFFLISIFATNWPIKLYHYFILKKLAETLETIAEKKGLLFSNVYSQINTIYHGKEIKIRFIEGSIDSIKTSFGLETRLYLSDDRGCGQSILECYPIRQKKHEWGDFKRFFTGDPSIDTNWYILTNNLESSNACWNLLNLKSLLSFSGVEQVLLNKNELIVKFKYYHSVATIKRFIDQLVQL